jgi:IS5 family transposase
MKKQLTPTVNDFEWYRKPTRREIWSEMNTMVPWAELAAVIEPYYLKSTSAGGRPAAGLGRYQRMHWLHCVRFDLSDRAVEGALYDSRAMRSFVGVDLGREPVPDETTVMRFRLLCAQQNL